MEAGMVGVYIGVGDASGVKVGMSVASPSLDVGTAVGVAGTASHAISAKARERKMVVVFTEEIVAVE